ENRILSYAELNTRSDRLAAYLVTEGVKVGDFVGICMKRSVDMLIGMFGILKSGAAYLPLDPAYPQDRLKFMIEDAAVQRIVTEKRIEEEFLRELLPSDALICYDQMDDVFQQQDCSVLEAVKTDPEHNAYVIYTSGSTGKPKGVQVPHRAVINFLTSMAERPGMTDEDVLLAVTTLSFDIAVLELYLPLFVGAKTVIASQEMAADGKRLLEAIERYGITMMQATPATWRILLAENWKDDHKLKVLCGGEPFPNDLQEDILARASSVWNMYGPTETTVWSTCCQIVNAEAAIHIGKPIGNTQTYVLTESMQIAPIGVIGELYIGGDGVTHGYLNRPELTADRFVKNPFSNNGSGHFYGTGDLARMLPDGNIECLGRIDNQIKLRGFRIELGELESVLSNHPSVDKCVAAVREDQPGDARLVGYVVPKTGMEIRASDLKNHLRTKLPDYMVPQHFVELEELPLTPAGKVDRKHLPAPDQTSSHKTNGFVAPRDTLEVQLATLWKKTIGVESIGVTDNFFDIGGHSLLAVRLFSHIERMIGAKLPLALLYQAPTVEQLSAILKEKNWHTAWSTLVPIHPGGSKLPLFLIHGAGGNVLLYRQLVKHLGSDQPVYGLQAKGLDGNEPFHTRLEDMAAEYISEIQKLQPDGPYYLGGYCMGGTIAYEIARQLDKKGCQIALVAMFDTYNGWKKENLLRRIRHRYQRVLFHILNYSMIDRTARKAFVNEKVQESKRRILLWFAVKVSRILYKIKLRNKKPLVIMDHINDQAVIDYVAKPYSGKIDVFRTTSAYAGYEDEHSGWADGLTGSVEVHQLKVYPAGTLNEPFVSELASKLRVCLDKVQS
ncbi:MAG: amino acid adenylation domain-containing protein, partial [Calditrichia bacterium]